MLKWLSGEEGEPGSKGPGSPYSGGGGGGNVGDVAVEEMSERLSQTEQLVTQLKEMIREKDAALRAKDDQLKVDREACEAKLSKLRLQNKAKVTSLSNQLEELKKQQGGQGTPTHSKKGSSEGGEQASRGKIVLLKKKVEELEQQVAQRDEELGSKRMMLESQRQRGEEMDAMLTEKDKKLAEKEAYIVHLQTALAGNQPMTPTPQKAAEDSGAMTELQLLVQSLTRKVGEAEERYSLLQEQTDSLRELLATEKEQYSQKETMYEQNIQTFKDIILQKDNQLTEINQMHEQELFRLAAKSDASADLEQLLKALKQKLHEKEEVLLGKTQVIDVLQGEVDGRDQQIKELTERLRRLQVERESLESKMEAEKHVMRAQLRDRVEKQQAEVQRLTEQHQAQVNQIQQDLLRQMEELRKTSPAAPAASQEEPEGGHTFTDSASIQRIAVLEAQAKQKTDEASKSEAKFLKMKAWSKSRIRQLEEELKKSQAGGAPPDLTALRSRITALEEEREENLWKVEQYEELKTKNEMLGAKLVIYEEQQRTLQADLEQFTKRAASQASESGSADDAQSQVLEWQEMVAEAVSARDRAREEKAAMALRISHMDEEREALATRQQELEEELAQARGLGQHRAKKLAVPSQRSLQDDFEFDGQASFQDPHSTSESTTPMEGENMGGGLRSVVEELELERNQLQEQILSLEERCQDLEDRLQLQARIETLQVTYDVDDDEQPCWVSQNESEKLQSQLASVRSQQSRDSEKHQLLVNSLNEQLKGLSDTQESLESSLIEKENTLAKTSEKLELISSLRESLGEKEIQYKEVTEKLVQTEHTLENISKKCSSSEKQCSELKTEVADLQQKLNVLKERTQKQEVINETLQTELDQTNEELDKINTTHLEERAQLIHDLQSCEREIDGLKDILLEKDKEILSLSGNMAEYAEQVTVLKQEIRLKEEHLIHVERALSKAEQEAIVIRDSQTSDQQALNSRITELVGKLTDNETELVKSKQDRDSKVAEVENLMKQAEEDKKTIQDLRGEIQKQTVSHRSHLSECETHIMSLKEQLTLSTQKLRESGGLTSLLKDKSSSNEKLQQQLNEREQMYEKERKSFKEEQNKLVSQIEKYNEDNKSLSRQLEEQVQREEHLKKVIQEKLETIASLENQLKAKDQQAENERDKFNSELQLWDSEKKKLSSELQTKSESISKHKNILKGLKTEKQELQDNLKALNEELEQQRNNVKELKGKVMSALEINSSLENQIHSLTQEKQRLEVTVAEVTAEKEMLSAVVSQHSKVIEEQQKDKEELTLRNDELNRDLKHSAHSNSEALLAKSNECGQLSQLLRDSEDKVRHLQEQVQSLTSEVDQLQLSVSDKEQTATRLIGQLENLQNQQTRLQETLSHLQQQECSLKSALTEKQEAFHTLHSEVSTQRNIVSELQAEAKLLHEERSQLRQQVKDLLENMTQQSHKHKDELDEANKTIKSLSDQASVMEENTRRLESDAERGRTELLSFNSRFHSMTEENQQLRAACESREKELAQETQRVFDLNTQLQVALEQNSGLNVRISSLTADNQRLQEELAHNVKLICEVTNERGLLQEKNRGLESQVSDNQKTIEGLKKTNEELTSAADEITKILKETEKSNSAGLLEKTSECANLSKMLRATEEQLQRLQEQVEGLKMEIGQLNLSLNEKEQTVSEQRSQLAAQSDQLLQLQDTISMLQEQGSVLKSGLMEKDVMLQQKSEQCITYENELKLQNDLLTQMQAEMQQREQVLREVTSEFQSHKDELNKRNESVLSLSSQLGAMNESAAATEAEMAELKAALQKLSTENMQLSQDMDQSRAQILDFKDRIQALNEQNALFKCELQKTVTALTAAQEEVSNLKAAVSERENELEITRSEKDSLHLNVQEKDESLRQQQALVQQLSSTVAVQDEQLKQKAQDNVSLSAKVSELQDCVSALGSQVDSLSAESFTLKDALKKKEETRLEYQSHSSASLHAKEEECENFKEQISHLEESVSKLNATIQVQAAEVETLKKDLEEKEAALLDKSRSLQDAQRRADEALLFKSQFTESTELVSQLQSESENLRRSAGETQSAFNNLQEKYAANLEELQDVKKHLSQQSDEVLNLRNEHLTAQTRIETLSHELAVVSQKLKETEEQNSSLLQEKEEAFASHQASVSVLTVETERLKAQHLQVVAQMNALTENLEQREMALHAINSQYTAQAKHASQFVSDIQKLEEQNKRLKDEVSLFRDEHQGHLNAARQENARLQQEVKRLTAEREELEQRHHQIQMSQVQMEQQSSSLSQDLQQMVSEKQNLQAKVSAKDQELCELRENVQKVEQILQDSEKEWLLVLEREKEHKNLLAEQLRSVENEMKAKDLKVNALKQDLDSLHEKLEEASSAIRQRSDQLSAKEVEASASRTQLEKVLASVQQKDHENNNLQQTLKTMEFDLHKLLTRTNGGHVDLAASSESSSASLQDLLKQVQEAHESEVDALKNELDETVTRLQQTQNALNEGDRSINQQLTLLQDTVELLQNQLKVEREKVKEAAVRHSSLLSEAQAKDEQINCMNIQISQQKELLAGLSQQLRDKDASIAQVMEAAANERMKLSEENVSVKAKVESIEQEHATSMKGLEDTCQQLEERLFAVQTEIEANKLEKLELLKRNDDLNAELAKGSKEKEAVKKKLQAALIVRKELLKKIEQYEKQKEESLSDESQVSLLREKVEEVRSQAQAAENTHQEQVSCLEKSIAEKEAEILQHKMQSDRFVTQLEILETALNEKEARLSELLRTLNEKNAMSQMLQSVSEERTKFERERNELVQKLEELQSEVKGCKDELEEKSSSAATVVDLESELAQVKVEKAMLQKKAQAAMLARKETMKKAQEQERKLTQELCELKDDYKALLEQHCQQTNQLNAVQLNFDENVKELEQLHKACLSHVGEVEELKVSLAEKERQCQSLIHLQAEMESVKSKFDNVSLELSNKDEALSIAEQKTESLKSKLQMVENELEEVNVELREKIAAVRAAELMAEQEKEALLHENAALKTQLSTAQVTQEHVHANKEKFQTLMEQKEAVSAQCSLMKAELEAAVALVSQKSLEMSASQRTSAEMQQRLSDDLEKAELRRTEAEKGLDLLKQDKEHVVRLNDELRDELTKLNMQLKDAEKLNQQLQQQVEVLRETPVKSCDESFQVQLKEREASLIEAQIQLSEKEELIAALESQLQQQVQIHEAVIQKMRADTDVLQRESEQDNQGKTALLNRKLQAALVSRKELKEEAAKLKAKEAALESSVLRLEKLNTDLERSVLSLTQEKEQLSAEVDRILHENRSLSAACDSLKLTIENITQQKQAFSCQLESLKDSQTEELSKWKSKHAELKQEYESLLQAYENVGSEMDKMRQLLEGAKRDRQEALRKMHKYESELKTLQEKQTRERDEENESLKEKYQRIEELQEENRSIRQELTEMDENHKMVTSELNDQKQRLEVEICQIKASTEDLRLKLTELQAENSQLAESLEEANSSLKSKHLESNTYTNVMQLKLDEALTLNNALTAQIEAQNTELGAQVEINNFLQKEKKNLLDKIEKIQNDYDLQLGKKDEVIKELEGLMTRHSQETISLNEKVRILEDDKCLLQEELENVQEISDKVKNENEYLETVILKNSERIDELTESVNVLQSQSTQLSIQLAASKETSDRVRQEKEEEQLRLVREFEQKLKDLQRGNQGSKNVKRELQELLKEKHQEINQLQQNCIKYQEVILDLESSLKSSQSEREQADKEQKKSAEKVSVLEERAKRAEAELTSHQKLLQEATEETEQLQAERERLAAQVAQHRKPEAQAAVEDESRFHSYAEKESELQRQIEELLYLKGNESQKVDELKRQLDARDLQVNALKRAAETSEARLSALSSTPHGAEAANLWNDLYQKSLHEKDNQLLEQGFVIKRFLEDMRAKEKDLNEVRVAKSRLERTLSEYSVAAAAQQRQLFVMSASNAELSESVELMAVQVKELSARGARAEQEKKALIRQLADRDRALSQAQLSLQQTEKISADAEAQLLLLQSQKDKVQGDFEKQEGICLQLKTLLQSKDAEISSLLSCKDGQMSGYLEQLQANYRSQAAVYEDRLTSARYQREQAGKELRAMDAKVRNLQVKVSKDTQEKEQMAAKVESFKNSMVSLQGELERVMSEYRILEAKSELGLKGKEGSLDSEGGAAKGLKHEIRKLLHQMDDLNSENAMLRAQLLRYREDLNQVLSLKDNQLKVLLKKQQDVIRTLEHQKAAAEKQSRESRLELQKEEEAGAALKAELSKLQAQASTLKTEILNQKKERATTNEGKVIADLREAVAAKAAECNHLQQRLLSDKVVIDELKEKLHVVENEIENKLAAAEEKYNSELHALEREVELMRSEREAADRRLAEFAKELLEMEQQLSEAKVQSKDAKAQKEALCKAMAALQNDRDQLIEDFKVLRNRYDEELRETQAAFNKVERSLQDAASDLAAFSKERDVLVHRLKAVESTDAHTELNKMVDELSKAASAGEKELKQAVLENEAYRRQLSAFSRSMASLQNDRDRLMDELLQVRRAAESGPGPDAVSGRAGRAVQSEQEGLKMQELQQTRQDVPPGKESSGSQEDVATLRSHKEDLTAVVKQEAAASEEVVHRLEAERLRLHTDLQRCMYEIQQRDQYFQQLGTKLQQAVEEKGAAAAQLRTVTQTLRDTQNRCHWLESQLQGQAQGSVFAEVAPGAPQERSNVSDLSDADAQLRDRLRELELHLTDERARRESAEEALRVAEDRAKSVGSRDGQRDFSIEMDAEEEWEALSLNPNQPLITRTVRGGMVTCRRWLRGRSLYFSRLLTSRARSRYFFLAYLLTIHVLVVMCLTGVV
ncbi:golgin subfamily B member 1-like isoform X2 [Betta splendens]|uniref:Golgin subfamily B member 1-like isoform X2 n=1 Tax=Betta splendens TaxID=158456 RepID=A0A9W2XNL4_BETSP|nr:golgin subfamily B member 1-like isoform X2 [Betta splendens]